MKTLQTFLKATTFILLLSLTFTTQAQNEKTNSAPIAGNQSDYSIDELELDATKAESLKAVNQAYTDKMKQLMRKGSGASKDEIEALERSYSSKIKSILDIEEYEKYLLLQAKIRKEKEAKEKSMKSKQ
jgi:hypothetical protein